jgi:hypothetical protein
MAGRMQAAGLWRIARWAGATGLLLVPLVAMRFTEEVDWTAFDFVFAAAMLYGVCALYELAIRLNGDVAYRMGTVVALAAGFLTIWVNGAVGIIGDEDNPYNLMFGGVLLIAMVGAVLARFRAEGMARAMVAAAAGEILIAVIVVAIAAGANEPPGLPGLVMLILGFAGMWTLSAALFWTAARGQAGAVV